MLKMKKDIRYQSLADFNSLFSGIIDSDLSKIEKIKTLYAAWIKTPLGAMLSIADTKYLYLLEFADWCGLPQEITSLRKSAQSIIVPGEAKPLTSIKTELEKYFHGELKRFKTPLYDYGTPFQKLVWSELKKIEYGTTCSYYDIATLTGNPKAYRAVANANGKNKFAIVIPCHRVINHNGELGGYGGGLPRKQWLIDHEKPILN